MHAIILMRLNGQQSKCFSAQLTLKTVLVHNKHRCFWRSTPVSDDFYGGDFARISLPDSGATPPTNSMLCTLHLKALQALLAVSQVRNRPRVFLYAVNSSNECYSCTIVLNAFYNWILLAERTYVTLGLRWRLAISISLCICYCFDVTWNITIVKTDKTQIHYSVQRDTSAEHEPSRITPATSLINPQQQSHFTFSRP